MATTFGRQPEDPVVDKQGNALPGITLTLLATYSDAAAKTSPVATVVSGDLGRWTYSDPFNRSSLFARDPNGNIWALESEEVSSAAPVLDLSGVPSGSTFAVYWDPNTSSWKLGGTTITARPTTRTDLTMIVIGGSSGPAFGIPGVDIWLRDA